jgi:hypothetical protein
MTNVAAIYNCFIGTSLWINTGEQKFLDVAKKILSTRHNLTAINPLQLAPMILGWRYFKL